VPSQDKTLQALVQRAQYWLTWFIDGGNYLDLDDDWVVYMAYAIVYHCCLSLLLLLLLLLLL
jgi:hypothetical protein